MFGVDRRLERLNRAVYDRVCCDASMALYQVAASDEVRGHTPIGVALLDHDLQLQTSDTLEAALTRSQSLLSRISLGTERW